MYKQNKFKRWLNKFSQRISLIASGSAVVVGLLLGIDTNQDWVTRSLAAGFILRNVNNHAIFIYALITVLFILSRLAKKFGHAWVWEKIQFILDEYQGQAFTMAAGDPEDHHRVTIFKLRRNSLFTKHWSAKHWLLPWGRTPCFCHYLVPVARSGWGSKKTRAAFHVPDNSDNVEGVAGRAWHERGAVVVGNLPNVNSRKTTQRDKKAYATATKCDLEMIDFYRKKGKKLPRAIVAIPIEVKGTQWGVVVLDSRRPDGVQGSSVSGYRLTLALLGQLLEAA